MTQFDLRERLSATAETFTPRGPAPMADVIREARAIRRRRRRRAGAAAMAAAVVVGLGGVGVWQAVQNESDGQAIGGPPRCPAMVSQVGRGDVALVGSDCTATPLLAGPTFDYQAALSPDGTLVAFARTEEAGHGTRLLLLDRRTGDISQLASTTDTLGGPEFSPDSQTVAFWLNDGSGHPYIHTVSASGGEPVRLTTGEVNEVWPSWSPDGTRLAFVRGNGELVTADVASGGVTVLSGAPEGVFRPFWESDETLLAAQPSTTAGVSVQFRLIRMDADSGEVLDRSALLDGRVVDAVSDDLGIQLATTDDGQTSRVQFLDADFNVNGSVTVDGEPGLVARSDASSAADSTTDLEGTWTVEALVGPNGESVLVEDSPSLPQMTFADGLMVGTTGGCNDIFGRYVQSGDQGQDLSFPAGSLGTTLVGCEEAPLVTRLSDVRHVSGSGDIRYLHAENWMIIAELRYADSSETADDDSATVSPDLIDLAQQIVEEELSGPNGEEAQISSATATVGPGKVMEPNVGPPCESGTLLKIKLIGSFPHITTSGYPVPEGEDVDFTVTALLITADAETGRVCLTGVQIGEVEPLANSFDVPLA